MEVKEKNLPVKSEESKELILSKKHNKENFETPITKTPADVFVIFSILVLIFITIIFLLCMAFTLINMKNTNIIKGVSIKGIDVSNLSIEQAKQKINQNIKEKIPEEIYFVHNQEDYSLSTSQLKMEFNIDEAVNLAYQIGRNGNAFQNNFIILKAKFSKINIEPAFSFDEEQLKKFLEDISTKLPDKMIESSCYIEGNNLILTKGKTGSSIKIAETISLFKNKILQLDFEKPFDLVLENQSPAKINLDAIYQEIHKEPINASYTQNPFQVIPSENGVDFGISLEDAKKMLEEEKEEYSIPLKVLCPNVTTNMIGTEAFPNLLSEFSTKYAASNKNRTTNLILAANKINGTVLMPGETFSYNRIVGARTIAVGYKEAPIYVNGKVEDGLGGGICQITTTLYNAVIYANLEITERSNHQFVPSYAGASRDATVVYGAIDFKFKNNRAYPIKITCSVAGGIANFKIFGLKTDKDYEVEISSRTTKTTPTAIYSEAYKILKQNGKIVSTQLLSKDVYKKH